MKKKTQKRRVEKFMRETPLWAFKTMSPQQAYTELVSRYVISRQDAGRVVVRLFHLKGDDFQKGSV